VTYAERLTMTTTVDCYLHFRSKTLLSCRTFSAN